MAGAREIVLEKICLLLGRSLQPQQVYEWALGFAVSDGYQALAEKDPLAVKAVQMLLDVNEDHTISPRELKVLEYYRQCLSGQREFIPLDQDPALPDLSPDISAKWANVLTKKEKTKKEKVLHALRVYVYGFAAWVLLWNFLRLFEMGGPWSHNRAYAAITFPFFIYGFFLILPMQVIASGKVFALSMVMSILAIAYFWGAFFYAVIGRSFNIASFFGTFFLGAVPASIALWLLIYEKYFKNEKLIEVHQK